MTGVKRNSINSICQCGAVIHELRLEFGYTTCIGCSTEQKNRAFMMFSHKTAPDLVVVNGNDPEQIRMAEREYRRAR